MKKKRFIPELRWRFFVKVLNFSEHPDYAERMIAAYPVGYGFTEKDLKKIKCLTFAEGEADIKVIVSWNTEGPDNKKSA